MEEEKTCANCKNYCGHYVKEGMIYKYLEQGHCLRTHMSVKQWKCRGGICYYWEERERAEEPDTDSLFKDILTQLKRIEEVLNDFLRH